VLVIAANAFGQLGENGVAERKFRTGLENNFMELSLYKFDAAFSSALICETAGCAYETSWNSDGGLVYFSLKTKRFIANINKSFYPNIPLLYKRIFFSNACKLLFSTNNF